MVRSSNGSKLQLLLDLADPEPKVRRHLQPPQIRLLPPEVVLVVAEQVVPIVLRPHFLPVEFADLVLKADAGLEAVQDPHPPFFCLLLSDLLQQLEHAHVQPPDRLGSFEAADVA